MNPDQLILRKDSVKKLVIKIRHELIQIKAATGPTLKALKSFDLEFQKMIDSAIKASLNTAEPRDSKKILRAIEKAGKITPDLLEEIRLLIKKEDRAAAKSKTPKGKKPKTP